MIATTTIAHSVGSVGSLSCQKLLQVSMV